MRYVDSPSASSARSRVLVVSLATLFTSLSSGVRAECRLEGPAVVASVRPEGTRIDLALIGTIAKVRIMRTGAKVEGLTPVSFTGQSSARDVSLVLPGPRVIRNIVEFSGAAKTVVLRESDGIVQVRIDVGSAWLYGSVSCAELSLGPLSTVEASRTSEMSDPSERSAHGEPAVIPRGNRLRVYRDAEGESHVTLILQPRQTWPGFRWTARGTRRLRIRTQLGPGVSIDGWAEAEDLQGTEGPRPKHAHSLVGGCGVTYGVKRYEGPASLVAGAPLFDPAGRPWGSTVVPLDVRVVLTSLGVRRVGDHAEEVVEAWLTHIPTISAMPCQKLPILVRASDLVFPQDTNRPPHSGSRNQ